MSLANDHYYGYVHSYIVDQDVTWLECAAASVCWSTMLVFYLEEPHGHLMNESMEGAQGRTQVRGNLFSFAMAWEDVYKCCQEVEAVPGIREKHTQVSTGASQEGSHANVLLPRSPETLASLVRVCIRGGTKDLAQHLDGVTMRPFVVLQLIKLLRLSGYAGYEAKGLNSDEQVRERMKQLYPGRDLNEGGAKFVPDEVFRVVDRRNLKGPSIVSDKLATPGEPETSLDTWEKTERPHHLVAETSSRSATEIHEEYKYLFAQYGQVNITTGSTFLPQFRPQYIGMVHPYTLPKAVGGYDVPGEPRWRRPELNFHNLQPPPGQSLSTGNAGLVKLFDLTRGLPQRIEGNFEGRGIMIRFH